MKMFARSYNRRTAIAVMAAPIAAAALGSVLKPSIAGAATPALYDFEDGTTQGWQPSGGSTAATGVANSQAGAVTGTHCLAVALSNATSSNWGSAWVAPPSNVVGGNQLSAWYKVPNNDLRGAIYLWAGDQTWYSAPWTTLVADGNWHQITYTVPQGVSTPLRAVGVWFVANSGLRWTGTVLIDAFQAASGTGTGGGSPTPTPAATPVPVGTIYAPNFPRLATLYSKTDQNTVAGEQLIAKHNLFVGSMDWFWGTTYGSTYSGQPFAQYLKGLNPNLILLLYYHSATFVEGDYVWRSGTTGYVVNGVTYHYDLNWHLMHAGSALTAGIGAGDTTLWVADLSKFSVNERAIVGGVGNATRAEMVLITDKSAASGSGALYVQRGINSQNGAFPALGHRSGEWVRSIAYLFGSPETMAMNVTSLCPATNINPSLGNQTWSQFVGSFMGVKFSETPGRSLDGVFLDNYVDRPLELPNDLPAIDLYNTNQATGVSDSQWATGMSNMASGIRNRIGSGKLIVGNPGGRDTATQGQVINGGMIEGVDQYGDNAYIGDTLGFYNSWSGNGQSPRIFIADGSATASSLSNVQTNYQALRFVLTWTLTNNGFFVYDEYFYNYDHSTDWWYDEYDNAGQGTGYLGQPLASAYQPTSGVYRRDFASGISLCNTNSGVRTISLGGTFRKIRGTQVPSVNNGSTVTSVTLQGYDGIILLR